MSLNTIANDVYSIDWLFLSQTISLSMQCCLITLYHSRTSFQSESILSDPAAALSTKFMKYSKFCLVISTIFTSYSPGAASFSRNHFLCSFIRNNSSVFYHEFAAVQSHLQASLLILLLLLFPHLQFFLLLKSRFLQSHAWGLESKPSKLLLMLIFWHFPVNHKCS